MTAVLDWSKLDARSITAEAIPFDLRNVVENALETVTHIARSKNIRLLLENPVTTDPQMPLLGDPHRYRQCLLNLLSNAISKAQFPPMYLRVSNTTPQNSQSPQQPTITRLSACRGRGRSALTRSKSRVLLRTRE